MKCSNCKKDNTTLISSKSSKISSKFTIHRKRRCLICGYEFETYELEKRKIKKRKIDKRTQWATYRFKTYVVFRMFRLMKDINILADEFKKIANVPFEGKNFTIIKKKGKLKILLKFIKKNKVITDTIPLRPRTIVINEILERQDYWKKRNEIFEDLPSEDMNNKHEVKIEKREFEKSIINHLRKNPGYNNKDFMINCFKVIDNKPNPEFHMIAKELFNNQSFWSEWQIIL